MNSRRLLYKSGRDFGSTSKDTLDNFINYNSLLLKSTRTKSKKRKQLEKDESLISTEDSKHYDNKLKRIINPLPKINRAHFKFLFPVGKGGFGKVWKCEFYKNKRVFAIKEMSKRRIAKKKSVKSVKNERKILEIVSHSMIVNMHYAFTDKDNLFLVMDYMAGGDLRYHLSKKRIFSEDKVKFLAACIFSGLEYIHTKKIIHRDLKPENLVFDMRGYLKITDFGIARFLKPENSNETSGTPGYMSPEVLCHQNHGIQTDYFALGVICYELLLGRRPYRGRSRRENREHILAKQARIKTKDLKYVEISEEGIDFVNALLIRKPKKRLGANGSDEVKNHPWWKSFPWTELRKGRLRSPYIPKVADSMIYKSSHSSESDDGADKEMRAQKDEADYSEYFFGGKRSEKTPPNFSTKQVVNRSFHRKDRSKNHRRVANRGFIDSYFSKM